MNENLRAESESAAQLVDIEKVVVRDDLPVKERVSDYIRQIRNPYCYRSHGIVVKISFAGKKSFEECLKDALFARDKI
mgnify:CR=1 FL=1